MKDYLSRYKLDIDEWKPNIKQLNGAIWLIGPLISADLSIGAQLWCD